MLYVTLFEPSDNNDIHTISGNHVLFGLLPNA